VETGATTGFPIVFRLLDANDRPVSGAAIDISVEGGAKLLPSNLRTDHAGEVRLRIAAGSTPGAVTVRASAGEAAAAAATVHVAPPPAR
jgi:hypothetical protein